MDLDYQLHRLGWKGFQHLCGTILRESMGQTLQTFSDVNDAGRDGAFHGEWRPQKRETLRGSFTIQCKHTARPSERLRLSDLSKEIEKARALGKKGLANNYLLLTNMQVSGVVTEQIESAFQALRGIVHARVYGRDWIERNIFENKQVRMNVPRIYGLGDLTQILDERAHAQAKAILNDLGDEFSRFVVTEAYRNSVKAITNKGFVFLLGEPCCGKSTIAAALALAAADKWSCELVRVTEPREFTEHWNPNNPEQFFWVDDAFGSTQYERDLALAWNRVFPALESALKKGAKAVFTSRDYVYTDAMKDLKDLALPELRDSQVVIHVEELTLQEKEQILYNHIKLGDQPKETKTRLKKHLPDIASHRRFLPETARRLSQPLFTKYLDLTKSSLLDFVENMKQFLLDTLRTIGPANTAAVALVFMRRGRLNCDLDLSTKDKRALERLGATVSDVRQALRGLEPTLFVRTNDEDEQFWRFKHPSIRDAFGTLIADDPALSDIYLENTPVRSLMLEVTCGGPTIGGVKVRVPRGKFPVVIKRLKTLRLAEAADFAVLLSFLRNRCGKEFLAQFLSSVPSFIRRFEYGSWMVYNNEVRLAAKLHKLGLLPERERSRLVARIRELSLTFGDAGCYREADIRTVLTDAEHSDLARTIKARVFSALRSDITYTKRQCIRKKRDAWSEFVEVNANLASFEQEFRGQIFQKRLQRVKSRVRHIELMLYAKRRKERNALATDMSESDMSTRSVFDDVDR